MTFFVFEFLKLFMLSPRFLLRFIKFILTKGCEFFMLFPYFTIFFIFIIWLTIKLRISQKAEASKKERFWMRESESNQTRKQDISDLNYISIPISQFSLPVIKDEKLEELKNRLVQLSTQKIVNLTGISNTDLKLQYGVANLPALSEFDANFTELARLLNTLAHRLYELGYISEAQTILEFGVACGTDIRAHYVLLASIYQKTNQSDKIKTLIEYAEQLNSLMKESILTYLNNSTIV